MAKKDKCTCKCQGRYHGLGNPTHNQNQKTLRQFNNDKTLSELESSKDRRRGVLKRVF